MQQPAPVPAATEEPAVERAFQLGWSIAELKGRVATEELVFSAHAPESAASVDGSAAQDRLSHDRWRGSMWRVAFDRVSSLHASFKDFRSVPNDTLYDPGDQQPLYLFPSTPPDYASTGAVWSDDTPNPVLKTFRLREATRRGLNCLDLLYLEPVLTLQPDVIRARQAALVKALAAEPTGVAAPASLATTGPGASRPTDTLPEAGSLTGTGDAIRRLTRDMLALLETWDAYLREQFADVGWSRENEHNLVAYEAGRALAALSWDLTRRLARHGAAATGATPPRQADGAGPAAASDGAIRSADPIEIAWIDAFNDRDVSYLQHQLAVLGQALDTTSSADSASPPPSTTLKTVIRSLDVWQRTVGWLSDARRRRRHGLGAETVIDDNLRTALIEQASIWQALVLRQEDLTSFTAPSVVQQLYLDATVEVEKAITPRQIGALAEGAVANVRATLAVVEEAAGAVGDTIDRVAIDAGKAVRAEVDSLLGHYWPWLAGLAVIFVLVLVATAVATVTAGVQNPWPTLASGVGAVCAMALGGLHLVKVTQQQAGQAEQFNQQVQASVAAAKASAAAEVQQVRTSVLETVSVAQKEVEPAASGAMAAAGGLSVQLAGELGAQASALLQYMQSSERKAFDEVQRTVVDLERTIAITYPLIDYVVGKTRQRAALDGNVVQAGSELADSTYAFLTTVIWNDEDRRQELLQVASAAFGPLGVVALGTAWHTGGGQPHRSRDHGLAVAGGTATIVPAATGSDVVQKPDQRPSVRGGPGGVTE